MRAIVLLCVAAATTACAEPGDLFGPPERPPVNVPNAVGEAAPPATTVPVPAPPMTPGGLVVETQADARLEGTLGTVRNFRAVGLEVRQQRTARGPMIEVHAEDRAARWWVMTNLQFSTPLTDRAWDAGSSYQIEFAPRASSNPLGLVAIGCSGPSRGNFVYDGPPTGVEVQVGAGPTPQSRVLTFVARWSASGDEVRGTVALSPE